MEKPQGRDDRLIGRERELSAVWDRFKTGGGITLVAGEPGIGKSRLLHEIEFFARQAGATVLKGGSTESAGMPPYLPFLEALGDFARTADTSFLDSLPPGTALALGAILPDLGNRLSVRPEQAALPMDQARLRLFEAVATFLHLASESSPTLLLLDDLQWADPASIELLMHLARRETTTNLSIIGAFREQEVDLNPALGRGLTELNRLRVLTIIRLDRLKLEGVHELAATRLGGAMSDQLLRVLYAHSEGNPFFAEELLKSWKEEQIIGDDGGDISLRQLPGKCASVIDAVRTRLGIVNEECRELMRTASVIGRSFDTTLLAETAGIDDEVVELLLESAIRRGFLVSDEDGDYRFTHDKIRECLYAEVTLSRRKRLHGFVGRALEQRAARDVAALSALAFHFTRSGDRERGIDYAIRAMEATTASFALEDAVRHGQLALALLSEYDDRRGELTRKLAETTLQAGNTRSAEALFESGAQWYLARGDASSASRLIRGQGHALWRQESIAGARESFERALKLLGDTDPRDRVGCLTDLGSLIATSQLKSAEGLAIAQQALAEAVQLGRPDLEAIVSRTIGNLLVRANEIERGIQMLERSLEIAKERGDAIEAAECCANLLTAHYWLGNAAGIRNYAAQQIAYAEQAHDLFQLRHVYCWLAASALMHGQMAESADYLQQQTAIVDRLGLPEPRAYLDTVRGMLFAWQGDIERAEPLLRRGIDAYRDLNPAALIWHLGQHAAVLHQLGGVDEALRALDDIESMLEDCPANSPVIPEALNTLVPMLIFKKDFQRLERYRRRLQPFSGRLANNLVDRMVGMINLALEDWKRAEFFLLKAEAHARKESFLLELARTIEQRALLERARGWRGAANRADKLRKEAAAIYDTVLVPTLAERVRQTKAARTVPMPAYPAGLSKREIDVLRLLAAGSSNRQIAERLFISEKTVANHITSIFTKTRTSNRVEAATLAIRHQLTIDEAADR